MEVETIDGKVFQWSERYIHRTLDGWHFEGRYKRRRNGMRNYMILCLKPLKDPGMFVAERKVSKQYDKLSGFVVACKEFKKELESN